VPLLRDAPDDLFALSGAAAAWLGIPDPAFVEKDYWVVELLRSVVRGAPDRLGTGIPVPIGADGREH
jgi:hypothetical protein